jgi:lipooligosaccharide transport system permease protein
VTTLSPAPRLHSGGLASLRRIMAVSERNLAVLRPMHYLAYLAGFAEPLLYLTSIGVGVGALIGQRVALPGGQLVPYPEFVAPAMVAASAMNGALSESMFSFFSKLKHVRLYDSVLSTPVRPIELALGELLWALVRGVLYSAAFLAAMAAFGLVTPMRALLALPAAALVGFTFGAIGMAATAFMRSWADFDLLAAIPFALFLFSGTFAPVSGYPAPVRLALEATPLYHGTELIRALCLGGADPGRLVWDVGYLVVAAALGIWLAGRRMRRLLTA